MFSVRLYIFVCSSLLTEVAAKIFLYKKPHLLVNHANGERPSQRITWSKTNRSKRHAPRRFARLVKPHLHVTHNKLVVARSLLPRIGRETQIFIFQLTTGSERTRLKENVSALTAGNPENSLTLRHDHNCRFRSTAAANAVRGSDNTVFPESDEELNFLRRLKISDW
jgi:hypothetical protein